MEIVLINERLFKDNGPIKEDTVITKFVPYINIAQKLYIERILGKPLTEELKKQITAASQKEANGEEITPENQALILKIAPALSFYAVYQGLPFHWASIVNKGVTLRNSENSDAVTVNDIAQLRAWVRNDAETLASDLIDYLKSCRELYPLWNPSTGCGCSGSDGGSDKNVFDAGIYIPKRRRG